MSPQQFGACADVVILSLLYVPATRPCHMSPQCAHQCLCNMSLEHDPSYLPAVTGHSVTSMKNGRAFNYLQVSGSATI